MSQVFTAGDTVQLELTVTRDGEPVNITGLPIRFALSSSRVVATSDDSDIETTVTDGPSGICVARINPSVTSLLRGTYRYQCEITDANDGVATVASGFLTFKSDLLLAS